MVVVAVVATDKLEVAVVATAAMFAFGAEQVGGLVAPLGPPLTAQARATAPVKPPVGLTVRASVAVLPTATFKLPDAGVTENPGGVVETGAITFSARV